MWSQNYPSQVGRSANNLRPKWSVLIWRRCKYGYVAMIERTRTLGSAAETSFAVVRSKQPILAHGGLLRAMDAVPFTAWLTSGRFCKARDPEAWHSSHPQAKAKFHCLLRRGGK
jgi:hypothetical protein